MRKPTVSSDQVAGDQLRAFFERIERLDEELKSINDDKKEVFAEAKGNGFDTKVMKIILKERRQDASERMETEALVELYRSALGMAAAPWDDDEEEETTEPRVRARAREGWNVDENGDGPIRRMTKARQAIFDALEADGTIPGRDTGRSVYFLHAPEAGVLKIGSSDDVRSRVRGLRGASPVSLVLLGTTDGGLKRELELHAQFAERRVHGEWFTVDDALLEAVEDIISNSATSPVAADQDGSARPALSSDPIDEQPTAAAQGETPDANTHGQTGTADISGLAASVPANAEAVAKQVGQSEQEAAVELPVDTPSHSPHSEADQADSGPQAAEGLSNSPDEGNEIHGGPLPDSSGVKGMMAEDQRAGAPEAQRGQTTPSEGNKSAPAHGPIAEGAGVSDDSKPVAQAATPVAIPRAPTAAENALSLRPYCLHAHDLHNCAGQGRKHCHSCLKAHADEIGEAA